MIALLQRVSEASVSVNNAIIASISTGILVFLGVQQHDNCMDAKSLASRVLNYRIFPDEQDRMNLNVLQARGSILAVPQFTLAADTKKGLRPSFTPAASPGEGMRLFDEFVAHLRQENIQVETGKFGANMQVSLCNDGPVTFWLEM